MSDEFIFESKKFDRRNISGECTQFTISNGYRSFLGSLEFLENNGGANIIAGIFDKNDSTVIELAKCPNPLDIRIYVQDENGIESFSDSSVKLSGFSKKLDMKAGIVYSSCIAESKNGKKIRIEAERFVSLKDKHLWASRYEISTLNFSGQLIIESMIDGYVKNSDGYSFTSTEHFNSFRKYDFGDSICMVADTKDENFQVAEICGLVFENDFPGKPRRKIKNLNQKICEFYSFEAGEGEIFKFNKFGITATSRDGLSEGLHLFCRNKYLKYAFGSYPYEKESSAKIWYERWKEMDVVIEGDTEAQSALRFNIFHLSSCSNIWDQRVSIAAKGMHGEGYKGHVFWDTEIFMLPFFIYTYPKIAKNLLMYRYETLDGARQNARLKGFKGAMYAWESAVRGLETTPEWGVNYKGENERIWTGDEEIHISGDIFYAVWNYWRATGDNHFMLGYGIEMLLEICVFISSRVELSENGRVYSISSVMGPDEFHPHVKDNFYTNYIFKWCLKKIGFIYETLKSAGNGELEDVMKKIGISESEIYGWNELSSGISINRSCDGKIIEQFENYFELDDPEISGINVKGLPEWPENLDLGKIHETRLIKQPDVLMLMYLLPEEFSREELKDNFDYYERRTMHKSSLSPCIHSILGIAVGKYEHAYDYFMKTILTDIEDNQGNTGHGLHAASAGGGWLSIAGGFGRFFVDNDGELNFSPWIPEKWRGIRYCIKWRNSKIKVKISHEKMIFNADTDIKVKVFGEEVFIRKDVEKEVQVCI